MENSSFTKYDSFESTNIKTLWYSDSKLQLIVQYINGTQYRYNGVTTDQWQNLIKSQSKGKYINESIKSKPFQKMILND